MAITVTFRHVEPSPALKDYAIEKLSKLEKIIRAPFDANVILSVEKYRHIAEVVLTTRGMNLKAVEETSDLYSAIDLVVDKVEKQAKKQREKRKEHSNYSPAEGAAAAAPSPAAAELSTVEGYEIVRLTKNFIPKPTSLEDAIKFMDYKGRDIILFLNHETNKYTVVCKLEDGRIGLIEP
ncbi:MAG: ribosome-associated translation inhibitor RaiA [Deltaproteobacteria bacterium]|nr:MAG: ribosome-associated translation inhibitor RaiA [Deltaproteobacteria bacterium]